MADTDQVLNLAAIIREVDGSNNKGAAALAESILDHPDFRAALADEPAVPEGREPVAVTGQPSDEEGPSAEDVEELCEEHCFNVEGYESIECLQGLINEAIARWGSPTPQPPADGKVVELPPRPPLMGPPAHPALERYGITWDGSPDKPLLTRRADGYWTPWHVAADLLERLSPPQPVPVSERLPEPEDCDAEGRCWWGTPSFVNCYSVTQSAQWRLSAPDDRFGSEVFWLPAHALPLPEVDE